MSTAFNWAINASAANRLDTSMFAAVIAPTSASSAKMEATSDPA